MRAAAHPDAAARPEPDATARPESDSAPRPSPPDAALAAEISAALLAADGDLSASVARLTPIWSEDLSVARAAARALQSRVLAHRVARRDAFRHGAALASALHLRPTGWVAGAGAGAGAATPGEALAASEQGGAALALRNVSHTLHLARFLEAAPRLVAAATRMLDRVAEEAPAASDLFQAHENVCACRRVRDYALLDALPNLDYAGQVGRIFAGLRAAEEQLEHYLVANIFTSVQSYASTDPRVLVAAVRIVQIDREEDDWWEAFLEKGAMESAGELVRPDGRREYDRRMYEAITESIRGKFATPPKEAMSVEETLAWIDKLLAEELESRRFVAPCFPPEYEIGLLFATEYHKGIMGILTDLFQSAPVAEVSSPTSPPTSRPTASIVGDQVDNDDSDVVNIVEWYRSYRWGPSGASLGASCFKLPAKQRDRLVAAVTRRSRKKLVATIEQVLEIDELSVIWHKDPNRVKAKGESTASSPAAPLGANAKSGIATTAGPEKVFGAVGKQVKEARVLGIPALDTEMSHVVSSALADYRDGMRGIVENFSSDEMATAGENYIIATANNMARCMEYAEELWDSISPFVVSENRVELEQSFEDLIDGFRDGASTSVQRLGDLASNDLQRQTTRFFSTRSGAEVMLDVTAVLTSFFSRYELSLLPYHFATFAGVCIRFVTFQYLAPFIALGSSNRALPRSSTGLSLGSPPPPDDGSSYGTANSSLLGSMASFASDSDDAMGVPEKPIAVLGAGLVDMQAGGVEAQVEMDVSNLFGFFRTKASALEKKQIDAPAAAFESVRNLFTCHPATQSLVAAHKEALSAMEALGPLPDGSTLRLPIESSEVMWNMRKDVKTTNLLEAVARLKRKDLGSVATGKSLDVGVVGMSSELRWKP